MAADAATWREDLEEALRTAAQTLRCGPLPRDVREAIPVPVGKPGEACPVRMPPRSITTFNEIVAQMFGAGLSELQRDLAWCRGLDLSWKEIEARHPGVAWSKLRREYDRALLAISRYRVEMNRK